MHQHWQTRTKPQNTDDADDVGEITLNITAPSSGGSDLTGYELQRYENGQWNTITAPATDAETFTDKGLTPGVKYYYAMRASNSSGTGAWSDVEDGVATAANPDKITTLTATATGETTIRLTWTEPANNGTTITGYALERNLLTVVLIWQPITEYMVRLDYAATDTVTEFIEHLGLWPDRRTTTASARCRGRWLIDTTGSTVGIADEGWSAEEFATGATGEGDPPKGSVSATTHGATPSAPRICW